jgi:hypothetical protein
MTVEIYYTGDLMTPDGSDTDCYGDGCEPGSGFTLENGWVDPDWTLSEVRESHDDVCPDAYDPENGPLIEWVTDTIISRIGLPEEGSERGTFYACDSEIISHYTGQEIRLAAHVYGASPAVLSAVRYRLAWLERCAKA